MDIEWLKETVFSGSILLAAPLAVLAGLVSFLSPCVIPLLPGYLSYATGISGADLAAGEAGKHRGRMLLGSSLFVLGFATVFTLLGLLAGSFGVWQLEHARTITIVSGVLVIAMGLAFMGAVPFLQRDWRLHKVPAVGLGAAPLLGVIFGLGWMPCVGPTLSAILGLSLQSGGAGRGALLSLLYALGLGIPFLIAGFAYERTLGAIAVVRRHQKWVTRIGGLMLVVLGVLLVAGWWNDMVTWIQVHLVTGWSVSI